jgi:hypothetical protein
MRRYLSRHEPAGVFDPAAIEMLTLALETAIARLKPGQDDEPAREALARGIIHMAKSGVRDPDYLARNAAAYARTPQPIRRPPTRK